MCSRHHRHVRASGRGDRLQLDATRTRSTIVRQSRRHSDIVVSVWMGSSDDDTIVQVHHGSVLNDDRALWLSLAVPAQS
jgi:hypothetical protein